MRCSCAAHRGNGALTALHFAAEPSIVWYCTVPLRIDAPQRPLGALDGARYSISTQLAPLHPSCLHLWWLFLPHSISMPNKLVHVLRTAVSSQLTVPACTCPVRSHPSSCVSSVLFVSYAASSPTCANWPRLTSNCHTIASATYNRCRIAFSLCARLNRPPRLPCYSTTWEHIRASRNPPNYLHPLSCPAFPFSSLLPSPCSSLYLALF